MNLSISFKPREWSQLIMCPIRLVPVVVWLYLTLVYVTTAFSLHLDHHGYSSRLQLSAVTSHP
jgi:hypothetical protein